MVPSEFFDFHASEPRAIKQDPGSCMLLVSYSTMQFSSLSLLAATATATELLLPLYNGPGADGVDWAPVQEALLSTPDLSASIIINVDSGPGSPSDNSETANWVAGGKLLGDLPNVSLLGYVHCSRCQRSLEEVQSDVAKWVSWRDDQGINLKGIFIDEAPSDGNCVDYMSSLTEYIRQSAALEAVVYNPGFPTTPHSLDAYYALNPTFISSLETCFATTSNGEDLCDGPYTVYDADGYGTTIDSTLKDWVGTEQYSKTAILIHGFHSDNGMYTASSETLLSALEAVIDRGIGAAVFTTNHWMTPNVPVADIKTMAVALDTANQG